MTEQQAPREPQVGERKPEEKKSGNPKLVIGGITVLLILAIVATIVNLIAKPKDNAPKTVKAAWEPQVSKAVPESLPQQAKAEISQMKLQDDAAKAQQQQQASQQAMQQSGYYQGAQQPQNAQTGVNPAEEIKRRRTLAVGLSPAGWVKGMDKSGAVAEPKGTEMAENSGLDEILRSIEASPMAAQGAYTPASKPSATPEKKEESRYQFPVSDPDTVSMPDGSLGYVLRKGRIIDAVLENKLVGEFSGPVRCHVTNDIRTEDGRHLLVPAGSVLLGQAASVGGQHQRRLAVLFTDLQVPGWEIDLGKATGLDQEGATALRDKVNKHLLSTVSTVAAIGALGGIAQANSGTYYGGGGMDRIYGGMGSESAMMGMQILQNDLNRPPEIEIRPGTRVRVWIQKSIALPEQK